jgi:hypothetical protein
VSHEVPDDQVIYVLAARKMTPRSSRVDARVGGRSICRYIEQRKRAMRSYWIVIKVIVRHRCQAVGRERRFQVKPSWLFNEEEGIIGERVEEGEKAC